MAGVDIVLHVASAIQGENRIAYQTGVDSARKGMEAVIKGAELHKIKKLIVTGSACAIIGELFKREANAVYDENDYAPLASVHDGYFTSKIV